MSILFRLALRTSVSCMEQFQQFSLETSNVRILRYLVSLNSVCVRAHQIVPGFLNNFWRIKKWTSNPKQFLFLQATLARNAQ